MSEFAIEPISTLAIEPIYGSTVLAVGLAIVTVAITLWVTPPTPDPNRRRWLVGLRLIAAAVLMLAIIRPAMIRTDNQPADAVIVVALDTSKSMTLEDGDGNVRFERQNTAAETLLGGIRDLDQSLSLQTLAYAGETVAIAAEPNSIAKLTPTGTSTDLAAALLSAITAAGGQPIAGVVLLGDGTQTVTSSGDGASKIAGTLDSLGVPLWTVPIGRAAGDGDDRDVSIASLADDFQWFAGNEVEVDFQVSTKGLAGIDIPVRLSLIDAKGKQSEVAVRRAQSRQSTDSIAMSVTLTAPDPGAYRLIVKADAQDGEAITINNQQMAFVDVREGGGRILYIEGSLRQEYVFLRRALRRFPDLDLVARWIPDDTKKSWPVELSNLLEPGKFDVYIIGDLPAAAIGDAQLNLIADAVDRGAALVTLGGQKAYGRGGYADTAIADVLPVRMNSKEGPGEIEESVALSLARSHPITDLGGDQPQRIWESLPDQLGANRFADLKVAPGIETLLNTKQNDPMLVIGGYSRGRVAAIAFDSTYRWWRSGRSDVHRRFWRQLMLWLLSRDESGGDKIRVEMDSRRFATDAMPEFQATVDSIGNTGASSEAINQVSLIAELMNESEEPIQLSTTSNRLKNVSSIRGNLPELDPGIYRLRVRSNQKTEKVKPAEIAFQVIDQSLEFSRPMADPVFMQQLASQTADQGGRWFDPDSMNELLQTIAERRKKAETPVIEKNRVGDGPKTGWPMFLIFAGVLSTEWFLRRRWNLA